MTPRDIMLIKTTFAPLVHHAEDVAELFYGHLFEIDPSRRLLFRGEMKEQGRKLMATLTVVVNGLERFESLLPAVRTLGARHGQYGVRDEHYATVGSALLWTLERGL